MKISEFTLSKPITCTEGDLVPTAAAKLRDNKLRHLFVVSDDNTLLGLFSAIDLVYTAVAEAKDVENLYVKDVMKRDITTFSVSDDVTKAIGFMSKTNILNIAIVDNGKLVGVLSYQDAMKSLLNKKQEEQ